jgi:hypothetical protein
MELLSRTIAESLSSFEQEVHKKPTIKSVVDNIFLNLKLNLKIILSIFIKSLIYYCSICMYAPKRPAL